MSWNYRIVREDIMFKGKADSVFSIKEVYYDEEMNPDSYANKKVLIGCSSAEDLKLEFDLVAKAFEKPILEFDLDKNNFTR